jgi:hypothetical protein
VVGDRPPVLHVMLVGELSSALFEEGRTWAR